MPVRVPKRVVVHPIVLLSVVDHYNRLSKIGSSSRVVGVLLGSWRRNDVVDIATSFAVPFDEDSRDTEVWYFDHDYLENMAAMFRKVNSRERIVGWYHSGPKLHHNDMAIHQLIGKYCSNPVLVVVDAKPKDQKLPTDAYYSVEEVHDDGTPTTKTFEHVGSEIGAEEAEEVGVEHLLRDIQDKTVGTLSQHISNQLHSLEGLQRHMEGIKLYLDQVVAQDLPFNYPILNQLQDIFNLLPNLNLEEFARAYAMKTNDQMLVIYMASLVRSVIALHNLIGNKVVNREAEKQEGRKDDKTKKDDKAATGKEKDSTDKNTKDKDSKDEAGKDKGKKDTDSKE